MIIGGAIWKFGYISFPMRGSSRAARKDNVASIKATTAVYVFTVSSVKPTLPMTFLPGKLTQINVTPS